MTRPVTIRGVHYKSHVEASRALGVTASAVNKAVERGCPDNVGLGRDITPIRIRGVDYPSIGTAARSLGLSPKTVSRALNKGTLETCGMGKGYRVSKDG